MIFCFVGCSGKEQFTFRQYKDNHKEFHQQHIEFIERGQELIVALSENLIRDLNNAAGQELLRADWKSIQKAMDDFNLGNNIYFNDMIRTDRSWPVYERALKSKSELDIYIPNHTMKIELALIHEENGNAGVLVTEWLKFFKEESGNMKKIAEDYLGLF
jgi:hypothetical protein